MLKVVFAFALSLLIAMPAWAAYVFYNREVGEWTATCWRDMEGGNKACRLSAPPELLAPMAPQNVLVVEEISNDVYRVVIEIRDATVPGLPAFVRVDANPAHEAPVANGMAVWHGPAAVAILKEIGRGQQLVFRVHTAPEGLPRDMHVMLGRPFSEAFTAYRQTLRAHKIINAK
jgi:hypothetical protein